MDSSEPEILYDGRHLRLLKQGRWEYAQRKSATGIVAIVAVTPDAEILFVEQDRIPVGARVIEFPAGLAGDIPGQENEALKDAARRELEEETGWRAAQMTLLCEGPVSSGSSSSRLSIFMAGDLKKTGPGGGDSTESIQVHQVPLASVEAWLAERQSQGRLVDPKIYAGLYFLKKQHAF